MSGPLNEQERDREFERQLEAQRGQIRELRDEVEAWRGAAGAIGIATADPRATLIDLVRATEEHHRDHHAREDGLRARVAELEAEVAILRRRLNRGVHP